MSVVRTIYTAKFDTVDLKVYNYMKIKFILVLKTSVLNSGFLDDFQCICIFFYLVLSTSDKFRVVTTSNSPTKKYIVM
jgi:hypothetical protein